MDDQILKYVQSQIAQAPSRLRGHITDPAGKTYPQRHIYKKLEKHLQDFVSGRSEQRWVVVPGLRGVGKTTVLSQLFLDLFSKYDPLRILYVSLDEVTGLLNSNLMETLEAYETILGQSFERLQEPVFIFIDEVQYDPKWGLALKSLYDRSKKVFICCTGSSAVSLQTNPDIYRRVIMAKLYPLSFPEYQMLRQGIFPVKGLKERLKQIIYFSKTTKEIYESLKSLEGEILQYWSRVDKLEIQQYLSSGTLPFALQINNPNQVYESINGLLDKIVQKDIESLKSFNSQTIQSIKRLLFLLADANDALSVSKLPNLLGIESLPTIQKVFSVLEQAELLIRVAPYGSQKSKLNKPSKYLFMSPSIRMALLGLVGKEATHLTRMGKLLEDATALHFNREFVGAGLGRLSYDAAQGGADFILQIANQKEIVVEVGIGKKDTTQVKRTMEKIKCQYGIVISDGNLAHFEKDNIVCIPLSYFLLM
jgi:hypothetical protein